MELENSGGYHLCWFLPSFFGLDFCYHGTPLLLFFFENVFVNHIFWGEMLRRFSCRGYRTWPCLSCRVGYRCSLYCCLHVTFHLTIPASLLLPLPFAICINAICFLSARRFASLLLTFSRFSLILFLTVVLATATFFFTELSHLEQLFILDTSLATGWKNYFGTYYAYLLFFVLRMFAIDLGTIVKVISRSP